MIDAIATAIMDRYNSKAGNAVSTALTGGLWFSEVPADNSYPYAVFTWNGSTIEELAGGRQDGLETAQITVEIYSKNDDGGAEVFGLSQKFMECFDWCILDYPASGYEHISFSRQSIVNRGKLDNVWMIELEYEALFEH